MNARRTNGTSTTEADIAMLGKAETQVAHPTSGIGPNKRSAPAFL